MIPIQTPTDNDSTPSSAPNHGIDLSRAECLETTTLIQRPLAEVFEFFSSAENLEKITPPSLHFKILSPLPIEMREGARIDYKIRIHGIPVTWKTVILAWEPPLQFVDMQIKGPYQIWHHRHTFEETDEGVLMRDIVHFRSPLHAVMSPLYIRKEVARIFAHREKMLHEHFA